VAAVDLAQGAERELSADKPSRPDAFRVAPDGTLVIAAGHTLAACRDGATLWRREFPDLITAGPAVGADRAIAGAEDGSLTAVALSSGEVLWHKPIGPSLRGPIAASDDRVYAWTAQDEALVAVHTADGSVAWRCPVGDVLLQEPLVIAGRLLVVGKNSRILLLDTATGRPVAQTTWPTWLLDAASVDSEGRPLVVCADLSRRLTFLDAGTLKPVREVRLPARISGRLLPVSSFPGKWAAAAEADPELGGLYSGESGPALLAADEEGFCHILPMGRKP
jgi:hypothetical protein